MKKKALFIAGAVLLAAVIAVSAYFYPRLAERFSPEAVIPTVTLSPDAARDFTVYGADGTAVRLSDFAGRPVVVNIWATWCGPCRNELPDFNELAAEYADRIDFMMVNIGEDADTVGAFMEENGYTFPLYYDTDGAASEAYAVSSIPRTLLINADGTLAGQAVGTLGRDTIIEGINMILPQN